MKTDHNNEDFDKDTERIFILQTIWSGMVRTLPLGPDKRICQRKGCRDLWESKIVREREVYQNGGAELKGDARVNSWRTRFKMSSWKGV